MQKADLIMSRFLISGGNEIGPNSEVTEKRMFTCGLLNKYMAGDQCMRWFASAEFIATVSRVLSRRLHIQKTRSSDHSSTINASHCFYPYQSRTLDISGATFNFQDDSR